MTSEQSAALGLKGLLEAWSDMPSTLKVLLPGCPNVLQNAISVLEGPKSPPSGDMTYEEFSEKLMALDCDQFAEVLVNHPYANGRDIIRVDSIDIDGDGNLVIWADK